MYRGLFTCSGKIVRNLYQFLFEFFYFLLPQGPEAERLVPDGLYLADARHRWALLLHRKGRPFKAPLPPCSFSFFIHVKSVCTVCTNSTVGWSDFKKIGPLPSCAKFSSKLPTNPKNTAYTKNIQIF